MTFYRQVENQWVIEFDGKLAGPKQKTFGPVESQTRRASSDDVDLELGETHR